MMENRGGVDGVDGDGPNGDGAVTGGGARADGRRDGACNTSVDIVAARQ